MNTKLQKKRYKRVYRLFNSKKKVLNTSFYKSLLNLLLLLL